MSGTSVWKTERCGKRYRVVEVHLLEDTVVATCSNREKANEIVLALNVYWEVKNAKHFIDSATRMLRDTSNGVLEELLQKRLVK